MMLGKRGRPPCRRTTSMAVITFDAGSMEAAPPPPPGMADFLKSCGLCNRRLALGRDIYMYRGDTAFCSVECREQQMKLDERKERRRATAAAKHGERRHKELAAAVAEAETVAAA